MDDPIIWLIIAVFYAPLHYLVPVLVVLMRSSEDARRTDVRRTLVDCTLSMLIGLGLAAWLASAGHITLAMGVLLAATGLPYGRFLVRAWRG